MNEGERKLKCKIKHHFAIFTLSLSESHNFTTLYLFPYQAIKISNKEEVSIISLNYEVKLFAMCDV